MSDSNESNDIEHFRELLLQLRAEILALQDARDDLAATVRLDQCSVGRLARMDALQQQAMAQNGQRRAAQSLARIEAALRRCDDGSYGFCMDCDEAIDPRRLNLDPTATRCIRCAEAHDG